jgi:hypothetical protein
MVRYFFAALVLFCLYLPVNASGATCIMCHGVMEGRMEGAKGLVDVHVDAEKFADSVHGALECTDCHITYGFVPHSPPGGNVPEGIAGMLPEISKKSRIDPVAQGACSLCHPQVFDEYRRSVHGQNIFVKKEVDAPLCLGCHGSPHYIVPHTNAESPVSHGELLETCGRCHDKPEIAEKYGFSTHVIEKYKESFHGKKYILGHPKVPICNNCHGSHYIVRVDAPDSPVAGEAKLKTCGQCHQGATRKFVAAPAHKYIGKDNPIPYYGEKALIVLVLGVFAFTISHVILEAFAEVREYVTRKDKGEGRHD